MNAGNKNAPSMHQSTKTERDYLNVWIKTTTTNKQQQQQTPPQKKKKKNKTKNQPGHVRKNLTQNGEP